MIKVFIPSDIEFFIYKNQLKTLYENSQDKITDKSSFEDICKKTFFYCFVENKENSKPYLLGGIYYFKVGEKLFINGFATKKHHKQNLECLKCSLSWFDCDIYAEAQNRASAICLLKCGFERLGGKEFVYRQ